jgi:hypothetical protein
MVQILSLIHSKDGKLSSLPYLPADVTNLKEKYRRESKLADIEDNIAYFKEKEKEDPDFFYRIKLDDEDRVKHYGNLIICHQGVSLPSAFCRGRQQRLILPSSADGKEPLSAKM